MNSKIYTNLKDKNMSTYVVTPSSVFMASFLFNFYVYQ